MESAMKNFVENELTEFSTQLTKIVKNAVDKGTDTFMDALYEATPVDTGALRRSLRKERINKLDKYGYKIGYDGYNSRGTAFAYIANALNKGNVSPYTAGYKRRPIQKLRMINEEIIKEYLALCDRYGEAR